MDAGGGQVRQPDAGDHLARPEGAEQFGDHLQPGGVGGPPPVGHEDGRGDRAVQRLLREHPGERVHPGGPAGLAALVDQRVEPVQHVRLGDDGRNRLVRCPAARSRPAPTGEPSICTELSESSAVPSPSARSAASVSASVGAIDRVRGRGVHRARAGGRGVAEYLVTKDTLRHLPPMLYGRRHLIAQACPDQRHHVGIPIGQHHDGIAGRDLAQPAEVGRGGGLSGSGDGARNVDGPEIGQHGGVPASLGVPVPGVVPPWPSGDAAVVSPGGAVAAAVWVAGVVAGPVAVAAAVAAADAAACTNAVIGGCGLHRAVGGGRDHSIGAGHPVEFVEQLRVDHHGDRPGRQPARRGVRQPVQQDRQPAARRHGRLQVVIEKDAADTQMRPIHQRPDEVHRQRLGRDGADIGAVAGCRGRSRDPHHGEQQVQFADAGLQRAGLQRHRAVDVHHQRVDAGGVDIQAVRVGDRGAERERRRGTGRQVSRDLGEGALNLFGGFAGLRELLPDLGVTSQGLAALEPVTQVGQRLRPGVGHGAGDGQRGRSGRR